MSPPDHLLSAPQLSPDNSLARIFARAIAALEPDSRLEVPVSIAARLTCAALSLGHAYLDLTNVADILCQMVPDNAREWLQSPDRWIAALRQSHVVQCVETDTDRIISKPDRMPPKPLVIDDQKRCWLYRYWHYKIRLIALIQARIAVPVTKLSADFMQYFEVAFADCHPVQRQAAMMAMTQAFSILSGGPGTGKTRTIAMLIAFLRQLNPDIRIRLVAPTGKAAARMRASLPQALEQMQNAIETLLPGQYKGNQQPLPDATTLHRLLGLRPLTSSQTRQPRKLPPIDLLIVDEASMIDLSLAIKLLEALDANTRILLVGDKDQLAPVSPGAVFSYLCTVARSSGKKVPFHPPLAFTELTQNYRFSDTSSIGRLARAIRDGNIRDVLDTLDSPPDDCVGYKMQEPSSVLPVDELWQTHYRPLAKQLKACGNDMARLFDVMDTFRILTPTHIGAFGIEEINRCIGAKMRAYFGYSSQHAYYPGQFILILQNTVSSGLSNGDVGIVWQHEGETLSAFFPLQSSDNTSATPFIRIPIALLPPHQNAFAMSVHKTQGSEFDRVVLFLPTYADRLLNRSMLYTAVTRVRQSITIYADRQALETAVNRTDTVSAL